MPRATTSKEGAILAYFRTSPLATAQVLLGLAKDEVRERERRSATAKERATPPAKEAHTLPAPPRPPLRAKAKASKPAPAKKKSHKKKPNSQPPDAREDDFTMRDADLKH
jgi:hypothetical protein